VVFGPRDLARLRADERRAHRLRVAGSTSASRSTSASPRVQALPRLPQVLLGAILRYVLMFSDCSSSCSARCTCSRGSSP
jgi:hypothetical protein